MQCFAKFKLYDRNYDQIPVVNPGDWFGNCFMIGISNGFSLDHYIVEADSAQDAIDAFTESSEGHRIIIAPDDPSFADYDPETCNYGPSGQVVDYDHLQINGDERTGLTGVKYYIEFEPNEFERIEIEELEEE